MGSTGERSCPAPEIQGLSDQLSRSLENINKNDRYYIFSFFWHEVRFCRTSFRHLTFFFVLIVQWVDWEGENATGLDSALFFREVALASVLSRAADA